MSKLATVRALLAKAEDPASTEAEALAYNEKAAQLIAQYGIDAANLSEEKPETDVVGDRTIFLDSPYGYDKLILLHVIAETFRCKTVASKPKRGQRWALHLFGFGADLDRVELLFTSLLLQSATGIASVQGFSWQSASQKAADRRAWLEGFTVAVRNRLMAAEKAAAQGAAPTSSGRSMDLVLVDRTAIVQQALDRAHPVLIKSRNRKLSGNGFSSGHEAGQRANLGGTASVSGQGRCAIS